MVCRWFMQWESVDTAVEDMKQQVRHPSDSLQLAFAQSVRSWAEYLEYDREGKDGDPSLVGGFTSVIRLLLQRMGVIL